MHILHFTQFGSEREIVTDNLSTPSQSSDFTCHLCIFIKSCLCL